MDAGEGRITDAMNTLELTTEQFRQLSEQVLEIATDYLEELDRRKIPAEGSGVEIERIFRSSLPEMGIGEEALAGLKDVARYSRAQNGRFFGYVLGSGDVVGAAADLLCSVLNQNVTAWRSGPASATVEKTVVGWLAEAIGCQGCSGSLTGGGSSANLMGMAMAREAKAPANERGLHAPERLRVYASTEAHMSIAKAVALLGIGIENMHLIPVDGSYRMNTEELERAIQEDKDRGAMPLAVVATAGTVNTGAIDPLTKIAEIARRHGAWFHVDGSYGALAAIATPDKFAGLRDADSIALDPHKWLYQPLDCGCLLYRDAQAARVAFTHTGDYARTLSDDSIEGFAFFDETIELSRRFRALKLWFSLRYHGLGAFRGAIEQDLEHARRLGALIEETDELELMAPIELSAVCFRYVGKRSFSEVELNRVNLEILQRVIGRGVVYLSNATLRSKFCLRGCIVNHRTTDADIDAVVREVLAAANDVLGD